MGATPRFGTDGVRGVANTDLTPEYVLQLGRAAARVLGTGRVIVGRDTRRSSPLLEAALSAGIASEGVDVVAAGVVPTPAVAWLAADAGVSGAMITASHNPFPDNGVKLFAPGGRKLADDVESAIEAELGREVPQTASGRHVGRIWSVAGSMAQHYVDHLVGLFAPGMLAGTRLVVDCANGAMSDVAPAVLAALGAELVVVHASPDGCNINDHCGATYPDALAEAVRRHGADAGLSFDGDGDRVMAATSTGDIVDGDRLMAVVAPTMKADGRLRGDAVVATVMANLGFRRAMAVHGIDVVETPVGDRYVLEALERDQLSLGGEQSGHIIFPDLSTTGDGLLAGLVLLDTFRRDGRPFAEVAGAAMTSYPQVLVNVRTTRRDPAVAALVADEIAAVEAGLSGEGRVLVRPSGTEPVVRVMVEAPSADAARKAADELAAVIAARLA